MPRSEIYLHLLKKLQPLACSHSHYLTVDHTYHVWNIVLPKQVMAKFPCRIMCTCGLTPCQTRLVAQCAVCHLPCDTYQSSEHTSRTIAFCMLRPLGKSSRSMVNGFGIRQMISLLCDESFINVWVTRYPYLVSYPCALVIATAISILKVKVRVIKMFKILRRSESINTPSAGWFLR